MELQKKRLVHYDLLRVTAAFSVVMLHSAAQFWYTLDIHTMDWKIANSYDALFRFGVPIFVMISGALFLPQERKIDIKRLYSHNIFRLMILYIVWSCIYGLWDCRFFDLNTAGWKAVVKEMIHGRYHLWFLPMIIGIYILIPILRTWVQNADKKNLQYFLTLFVIFQVINQTLRALFEQDELNQILDLIQIEMVCSYIGYFILGYYIAHIGIPKKYHKILYISAVLSMFANVLLGNYLTLRAGTPTGMIFDSFSIFTFLISVALFLFFTEIISKIAFKEKTIRWIQNISADTLGIYVMHIGLMEYLEPKGIHSMILPNIWGIPLYAIFCFLVCLFFSAILRRIPFIGKYLC